MFPSLIATRHHKLSISVLLELLSRLNTDKMTTGFWRLHLVRWKTFLQMAATLLDTTQHKKENATHIFLQTCSLVLVHVLRCRIYYFITQIQLRQRVRVMVEALQEFTEQLWTLLYTTFNAMSTITKFLLTSIMRINLRARFRRVMWICFLGACGRHSSHTQCAISDKQVCCFGHKRLFAPNMEAKLGFAFFFLQVASRGLIVHYINSWSLWCNFSASPQHSKWTTCHFVTRGISSPTMLLFHIRDMFSNENQHLDELMGCRLRQKSTRAQHQRPDMQSAPQIQASVSHQRVKAHAHKQTQTQTQT